jgi:flagellar FliJ protein
VPLDPRRLARVHRVRTLQLGLAQADEARARDAVTSETALAGRIAQLAAAVAPAPAAAPGFSLAAEAHYRERLHRSAEAAERRVRAAEDEATRRADATRAARQDRTAVEKLIARGQLELAQAEIRALQDAPATKRNRHGPC